MGTLTGRLGFAHRRATSSSDFAVRLVVMDDHHDLIGFWVALWSRLAVT
jgi:hypothetical protein